MTNWTRRGFIAAIGAAALAGRAHAIDTASAQRFIEALTAELIDIVRDANAGAERSADFLALFKRTAALPQIGRFTMGVHWRTMTDAQKAAFIEAFERHAVRSYTQNIGAYDGQTITVTGTQDAGQRGVLVTSVLRGPGVQDLTLDWLVSDRGGDPQVVDVIAAGVSLAISQREEFGAMVEARRGDIDRFIADLRG